MIRDSALVPRVKDLKGAAACAQAVHPNCAASDELYDAHRYAMWLLLQWPSETTTNNVLGLVEYFTACDSDPWISCSCDDLPTSPYLLSQIKQDIKLSVTDSRLDELWLLFDWAYSTSAGIEELRSWLPALKEWLRLWERAAMLCHVKSEPCEELRGAVEAALIIFAVWYFCLCQQDLDCITCDEPQGGSES